jgi:hypothetical protein
LGYRRLREKALYEDDPMVQRVLGLRRLPDVSTISRTLRSVDGQSVENVRTLSRSLVLSRLEELGLRRITLDFDGSVMTTKRHAEGTAVGYNKKKKGARSYYPLFCTVAQTSQFLDIHHRPGNVHDSNGAQEFARRSIEHARNAIPSLLIESRFDSAFFSKNMVEELVAEKVEFSMSVPFERLGELKSMITGRKRWRKLNEQFSYFEATWKPASWSKAYRFVFVRQKVKRVRKEPLQLDLFEPREFEFQYQVIVTNKRSSAKKVIRFHHGRGSQEALFGEAKRHASLEYIPVRTLHGNQLYCMAAILAHNLTREVQMREQPPQHGTTEKRRPLWSFETLETFRRTILQRAGRFVRPQRRLTLVMGANQKVKERLTALLKTAA